MNCPQISLLHFSPTGSSRKIGLHLASALSPHVREYDLSSPSAISRAEQHHDAAIVAVPVYGGRIPARAAEAIRQHKGDATPAVSVVVYGGRAYEDALLELNDLLAELGFLVIASGAFVARHSIVEEIAAGRPDAEDVREADAFADKIRLRLGTLPDSFSRVKVPGGRPYKDFNPSPVAPVASEACTFCGRCAKYCPVSAIPLENPKATIAEKCILCMRCVHICPRHARKLPAEYTGKVLGFLRAVAPERAANEVFL